jgi:Tol biopolymer transport system component
MFYDPAIVPDRSEIAFVSGGDICTVPAAGGEARLLVSHAATETRPLYSPDGQTLAITARSTMTGQWWRRGHSHLDEAEIWLVRDQNGIERVWARAANGDLRPVTRFTSGRVLWPSISATTAGS